jgi:perosamine synthetase
LSSLSDIDEIDLPPTNDDRIHSWHLFPIRLKLGELTIDRNAFMDELKANGVNCSVHWRPLHLQPLYLERFAWAESQFPAATRLWHQIVSLPIFSAMRADEMTHVVNVVKQVVAANRSERISMVA